MSLNYGQPTSPTQFGIGLLTPLGLPVVPFRTEETPLPCYVLNAIAGSDDHYVMNAVISLHTFAKGNTPEEGPAIAEGHAFTAHNKIISMAPGDVVTLPDGTTANAQGWPLTQQIPIFQPYRGDPYIARYYARYLIPLRFTFTP
jgi:hypothetical protein